MSAAAPPPVPSPSTKPTTVKPSEAELTNTFRSRQSELQALVSKLTELEREQDEHALVLETITQANSANPDRKCFKLVGGILVERTVKDIEPELSERLTQIKEIIDTLMKEYKKKVCLGFFLRDWDS
ncbi:hypothetical protein MNV49_002170 [Pseudohyphozyma bogoriensis]|nr:hypothetical protein MNV49_002170 [Pseudohyphozyma bogoriensis]